MSALHLTPSSPVHLGNLTRMLPYDPIEPGCMVLVDRDCVGTVIAEGHNGWFDVRLQTGRLIVRHAATLSRVILERGVAS